MTGLPDELDREVDMRTRYRACFSTPNGLTVLTHMLSELCFFNQSATTAEEHALGNYARRLLELVGAAPPQTEDGYRQKRQRVVAAMFAAAAENVTDNQKKGQE